MDVSSFRLPPVLGINESFGGLTVRQILLPGTTCEFSVEAHPARPQKWFVIAPVGDPDKRILVAGSGASYPEEFDNVLRFTQISLASVSAGRLDMSTATWMRHPELSTSRSDVDYNARIDEVLTSWRNTFRYQEEDQANRLGGLRPHQIGAIHAVHAHWAVSSEPATVVMPTGTGKTETMLGVLTSMRCKRLLVIVPTDVLRTQLADKFLTLGLLKDLGIVSTDALYPIVGTLKRKPKNPREVDLLFEKCNVIVTTMQIAGQCNSEVQERMAYQCPFLFVDEAHHIAAPSWKNFKKHFDSQRVVQFTATPFRNDGKLVEGKIIFNFPLRKAQEQGYFKPIRFQPVREYDRTKADLTIANEAIKQLRADCADHDHILMARTGSIARAREVFLVYEKYTEFNPVQIHTGLKKKERDYVRQQIIDRRSRIVVCVDMLGEGFDLPELKIAALHDIRKSLAVTLQLTGRFTRFRPDLGEPTVIANIADVDVQDELKKLYRHDADWNALLPLSSQQAIQKQIDLLEFIEGFANPPENIPLQNIRPALSTVIYKTKCEDWTPDEFLKGLEGSSTLERVFHTINHQKNCLVIVTVRKVPVDWAGVAEIFSWDWELFIVFWDQERRLLFVNSSSNAGYYQRLAEALAGEVELLKGAQVFRCFSGIGRLRLQNVGLVEQLGRLIRYTMRAGPDVESGLTEAQRRNTVKANIFGIGYEDGRKTSVGCSYRGRIWSRRVSDVDALTKWCRTVGQKVVDESIDPDQVLKGTLVPVPVTQRPQKMPISVEWPEAILNEPEVAYEFVVDGQAPLHLYDVDIRVKDPTESGDLKFEVYSTSLSAEFTLNMREHNSTKDFSFSTPGNPRMWIKRGAKQQPLEIFFESNPPIFWFSDGSSLEGNVLVQLKKTPHPYSLEKIQVRNWAPETDITVESQGVAKKANSIQYRVIQELKQGNYNIIFDDDNPGEAADIVAIRDDGTSVVVDFYHCKFSSKDYAGGRIEDLYEVCGQAQKSIRWMEEPQSLFSHMQRREPKKEEGGTRTATRFEKGNPDILRMLANKAESCQIRLSIFVVQPGLSRQKASSDQLELLSVTENYLMETYNLPFYVIASP
ncbi:MAG: DEAD/DEAH box helicase family protein [Chloroflexi bacterium]|nr:DEAD/DEAH box helicase family protein [Chloroflexota bacterium]MDA8187551.1 DEAD/DEAH box helicase family protein [Dehalococcoidales bacterium]